MQETIKQINELVEQIGKAQRLLIANFEIFEKQQRGRAGAPSRRERDRRERNKCRCLEHFDNSDSDDELFIGSKNEPERESRRHRRSDRKRDRSHSRGRSRGHSRGRSHGRSRSRSHSNAAHRQMSLAVRV